MAGLIKKAEQTRKTLKRAGDADQDPADLASRRDADAGLTSAGRLVQIPLDDLTPNPRNPRDEDLDNDPATAELAASLHLIGQQQPGAAVSRETYLTRWPEDADKVPTQWVLMIGSRRRAAAKKNKWAALECVVRDHITPDLEQLGALAFHENVHRKGLNPLKIAYYLADQKEALGTEEAVAAAVGKTQPWVNQMLKLLKLTPSVQALVKSGEVNAAVGRDLARLSPTKQEQVLESAAGLPQTKREQFWRTRAWTQPPAAAAATDNKPASASDDGRSTPARAEGADKAGTKQRPSRAAAGESAQPSRIRVDVGTVAELAAILLNTLDDTQLQELVALLDKDRAATSK